jgi:hypothetical protein
LCNHSNPPFQLREAVSGRLLSKASELSNNMDLVLVDAGDKLQACVR